MNFCGSPTTGQVVQLTMDIPDSNKAHIFPSQQETLLVDLGSPSCETGLPVCGTARPCPPC